jgi:cytochrome c
LRSRTCATKATAIQRRVMRSTGISTGMENQFNTIAGWALAAGIAALGFTLVTDEFFTHHPVHHGGYTIEGETEDAPDAVADVPIATMMQTADAAKGEETFKKCASCHSVTAGGANGIGPNLHGIVGKKIGATAGFAYSPGAAAKGGNWDFESLNSWLQSPKKFIDGTKMSFAGLSKGEDRANVIAYLNSQGSNLPMPAAPAAPVTDGAANAATPPAK